METQHILNELEKVRPGHFPREALEAAASQKAEITPHLLDILVKIRESLPEYFDQPDYILHCYALLLLGQFREVAAYPLIIDFFSLPGDMPADFVEDLLTEDLHRILASVYNGDPVPLQMMIADEKIDEFTRSAVIETFLVLFATGQMSRETVISSYKSFFNGGMTRKANAAWDGLVEYSSLIYPDELMEDIRQAYNDKLVDELFWGPLSDRETVLEKSMDSVLKEWTTSKRYSLITDTISEMEDWVCFAEEEITEENIDDLVDAYMKQKTTSDIRSAKVPRNSPCPCGSGKKYKKCCGKNI